LALSKKVQELATEEDTGIKIPKKHNLDEIDGGNWYWYADNNPIINVDPDGYGESLVNNLDAPLVWARSILQSIYASTIEIVPKTAKKAVDHIKEMKKYHEERKAAKKDKYAGQKIGPRSPNIVDLAKRAKEWVEALPDLL
jgi:hypothetical protein